MDLRIAWFGHAAGRRADGLSSYSSQTVRELAQRGCVVRFFHHDVDGGIVPVDDAVELHAHRIKTATIPVLGTAREVEARLRDFRPDIVHCSLSFSLLDAFIGRTAHEMGAGTVATFHLPHGEKGTFRAGMLKGLYRYHRLSMRHYDRCIALSELQKGLLIECGYDGTRIEVIANAVDANWFSPADNSDDDLNVVIGYLGRLDPEKRVNDLAEAFVNLRLPENFSLRIAGEGVARPSLLRQYGHHPRIQFMGLLTTEDARRDFLRACDIFVLPSEVEGLALSLLEAMSAGCAVIATDVGDDAAAVDGCGLTIPSSPVEPALSDALRKLCGDADMRRRLGSAARQRILERYSLDGQAEKLLSLYRNTLQWRRSPAAGVA